MQKVATIVGVSALALVLAAGSVPAQTQAQTQAPQSPLLFGEPYSCDGEGAEGPYTVTLVLEKHGENILLEWNGGATVGYGFIDSGGRLVAFYIIGGTKVGVVSYKLVGGRLEGEWSGGGGRIMPETCSTGKSA